MATEGIDYNVSPQTSDKNIDRKVSPTEKDAEQKRYIEDQLGIMGAPGRSVGAKVEPPKAAIKVGVKTGAKH